MSVSYAEQRELNSEEARERFDLTLSYAVENIFMLTY